MGIDFATYCKQIIIRTATTDKLAVPDDNVSPELIFIRPITSRMKFNGFLETWDRSIGFTESLRAMGVPFDFDPSENTGNLTSAGYTDAYIARYVQCDAITETIEASACGSYDYNGSIYSQSGTYEHVLMSALGCDSVVTLVLTIHSDNYSNVDLYTTEAIQYNGITYDSEGDYTQELSNQFGCDSIVYIHVDFMEVNFDIQNSEGALSGNQSGIAYQWVDCNYKNAPISGATSSSFVPTISGSYALIVYGNDGSVISECIEVTIIGVEEQSIESVAVYPNPCQDFLQFSNTTADYKMIEVYDQQGKQVRSLTLSSGIQTISLEGLSNGLYTIRFVGKRMAMARFIKAI